MSKATHDAAIERIVKRFNADGYRVEVEPLPDAIEIDLGGYRPDLVARKDEDFVVVEVKTTADRHQLERYKAIAERVSSHPKWRFLLATVPEGELNDDAYSVGPFQEAELQKYLRRVNFLLEGGNEQFAVPYLWTALMTGMREFARKRDVPVDASSDVRVLNYLYSLGELSHDDFEEAKRYYELRNDVAHIVGSIVTHEQVVGLVQFIRRKFREWGVGGAEMLAQTAA